MPAKNTTRIDAENSFYHVYNRGVEKRIIFKDEQDYKVFLGYLKEYLSPKIDPLKIKKKFVLNGSTFVGIPHQPKNYFGKIELVAYCLMPNHFHFLIKQIEKGILERFMRSLLIRYSMYFNKKYDRVGSLFQGPYRSKLIENENYLLHLSRYIHLNPSEYTKNLTQAYSSYAEYLGIRKTSWINPKPILLYFDTAKADFIRGTNTYKDFVEKFDDKQKVDLKDLTLED